MSDDTLQETTVPGTDTTVSVGNDKAPTSAPAPDIGHQGDDAELDVLDLDADDGEEGGDAGGEPGGQEATDADDAYRPAWQRPEGLEGDALIGWKKQQGIPVAADEYKITTLGENPQFTDLGKALVDGFREFGVENDMPAPMLDKAVGFYQEILARRTAEIDKSSRAETQDALAERWGDLYAERMEIAKEGARVLPKALREALKFARTPDGRRVAQTAEFVQGLFEIGRLRTRKGNTTVPPTDDQRLAEITKVMNTDIDRYQREGLDKEYLTLMRRRDASQTRSPTTLSAAEEAEARELTQLMQTDIDSYAHRPYRGTGRTAADRLLELQRKRAGEAA